MKLELLYNDGKDIYIDMQQEVLSGDILDVGLDNYGIIYNLYKQQNKDASVDYIQGSEEKRYIEKNSYDSCILLFSLSNICFKFNKIGFLKDLSEFLRTDGVIHIWDIDKSYLRFFKRKIKVLLPEQNVKDINISDFNFFKDASKESTLKLMEPYFEMIDFKSYDNVYYIKAKKRLCNTASHMEMQYESKGSSEDEDITSGNKFEVRSQQFGGKILEGIHKRFKL